MMTPTIISGVLFAAYAGGWAVGAGWYLLRRFVWTATS